MTVMAPSNARREMFARLADCWDAKAPAIVQGPAPEIRWQGEEEGPLPGGLKFWARCSTAGVDTAQSGFSTDEVGQNGARFTTTGVIIVQVFAPMKNRGSYAKGELLAALAQRTFMAAHTPSGVWFRRPRINELDNDGTWYRWNVIADYTFDQAKGAF